MARKFSCISFALIKAVLVTTAEAGALPECETNQYSPTRIYRITDLGTLGGTESKAWRTDYYGNIWGESRTAGDSNTHAFRFRGDTGMVDISPTAFFSSARAAAQNAAGVWQATASSPLRAAWWSGDNAMHIIPTLGGSSNSALGIECNNYVVGTSSLSNSPDVHAFMYHLGSGLLTDLGTLGGRNSCANGIGECGFTVGQSQYSGDLPFFHAFNEINGTLFDLGTLGGSESFAYAYSGNNDIVGRSDLSGDPSPTPSGLHG